MAEQLRNRFMKCNDEVYSDTLIKFIPSDFRGRILCLFIGDLITEAAIAEKLPDADIYVADLPQFGFEAFDPNLHKLNFEFTPRKAYTESELVTEIQGMFEGLKMKFDYVLINPPFSLGNAVATECLKHSDKIVCLMPLSKYKKGKLWSKITQFSLADPTMFQDASVPPNLNISILENNGKPLFDSEEGFDLTGYNPDLVEVYKYNQKHQSEVFEGGRKTSKTFADCNIAKDYKIWFEVSSRAVNDGTHGENSEDWQFNHNTLNDFDVYKDKISEYPIFFYKLENEKAKDNLTKWWYRGKLTLVNRLLRGLNKDSGSCLDAIPAIQWSKIEESPLWKQGLYDEAVLDAMNLKMENGVVVEK